MADDSLLQRCSELYSNHYGVWSEDNPFKKKGRVKIGPQKIKEWISSKNSRIAYCENGFDLIGYAFCVQVKYNDFGVVSWVTQLVVHEDFRKQDVAKKILFSIWGMSSHGGWGLATANPFAVRALEKATRRRVIPSRIKKNHKILLRIGKENISYVKESIKYKINDDESLIDTEFYVDHSGVDKMIGAVVSDENKWLLGNLENGWEWFAFTFSDQDVISLSKAEIDEMLRVSDEITRCAYGRMLFDENHIWANYTSSEVDYIVEKASLPMFADILDVGCGVGRHSVEFASRGYNVVGVDYAEKLIERAQKRSGKDECVFLCKDFRMEKMGKKFDIVLALYDVVGSYAEEVDNIKLLRNFYEHLRPDGFVFLSVMNLQNLLNKGIKTFSLIDNPDEIQKIKPSNNMQKTGEVFDANHALLDIKTGIVYRKEVFNVKYGDVDLPEEMLVRDRRYLIGQIESMVRDVGFKIVESKFVKLGKWADDSVDDNAKEILLVLKK